MLVLSRKVNEDIIIDNDITIRIISIQNGIVKIGFEAPQDRIILRGELKDAIAGENVKASNVDSSNLTDLGKILKSSK